MSLVTDVATRISNQVAALQGKVDYVAGLAALVEQNALPQHEVCAFVLPLGFDDLGGNAATGMHTQMLKDAIGVVICVKAYGDASGRRAVPTIDELKDAIVAAIAGWAPGDQVGVFQATRGRLMSMSKGLVIYQLDFGLVDQLRIVPQ